MEKKRSKTDKKKKLIPFGSKQQTNLFICFQKAGASGISASLSASGSYPLTAEAQATEEEIKAELQACTQICNNKPKDLSTAINSQKKCKLHPPGP